RRGQLEGARGAGDVIEAEEPESVRALGGEGALVLREPERRGAGAGGGLPLQRALRSRGGEGEDVVAGPVAVLGRDPADAPREVVAAEPGEAGALGMEHPLLALAAEGAVTGIACRRVELPRQANERRRLGRVRMCRGGRRL